LTKNYGKVLTRFTCHEISGTFVERRADGCIGSHQKTFPVSRPPSSVRISWKLKNKYCLYDHSGKGVIKCNAKQVNTVDFKILTLHRIFFNFWRNFDDFNDVYAVLTKVSENMGRLDSYFSWLQHKVLQIINWFQDIALAIWNWHGIHFDTFNGL
jgi:hypothetical protein